MKIFFKYIAKCMTEKKARFALLILAISLSTGLLVSITGAVQVAIKSFEKPMTEAYEGKEITITSKKGEAFFTLEGIKEEGVQGIQGEVIIPSTTVEDEPKNVSISGRENNTISKEDLLDGNLNDFIGEKCIISKRVSEEEGLKIGDKLELIVGGEKKSFIIEAISSNNGRFYIETAKSYGIIVPYGYLESQYKLDGKFNYYLANKEMDNIKDSIKIFNENNSEFEAKELFDEEAVKSQMGQFTSVLYVMLLVVVVMSAIIIYGSFKLTITERLSVIGTFLSQGATHWTVEKILYLESIAYGIIGAILGNVIGLGGLYLINYVISPLRDYGVIEKLVVNPSYFIIGTGFAIILSFISAVIPIRRIRKIEVKEVILNNVNISMRIGWSKFIIGAALLAISICINFVNIDWAINFSGLFIIISIIGLVLMYPKVIDIVTNLLFNIFRGRSKVIIFALNNLRTSKVLMGNITLIVISLLSIFMINSIGTSMKSMVTDAYSKLNFDISISEINGISGVKESNVTEKIVKSLKENKNINEDSIQLQNQGFGFVGKAMVSVEGIEKSKYKDFNGYLEFGSSKNSKLYDEFEKAGSNKVIITNKLKKTLDVKVGDKIKLDCNEITKEFEVLGSVDGKLYNNGQVIFMDMNDFKREFNIKEATEISIKTSGDPEEVKEEITPIIKEFGAKATTKAEFEKDNIKSNQMVVNVLSIFSYMAMFIAALGVLNNIIIGFLQRKRELAVFSSVGMTGVGRGTMLITESILSVVWSLVIAIPYSYLGLSLLTRMLTVVGMPLNVELDVNLIPLYFIASLVVILLATIPILFKNRKLSIIEELKYE
ncbi:ABC transporter permease [Clostridium sp. LP20]|uniref:ABC transporter permease n=1 Tax=Clostridium sp. LP20 TaxID=3418665 RepID=UPI003EE78EAA